jgi:hypothetical protein
MYQGWKKTEQKREQEEHEVVGGRIILNWNLSDVWECV